VVAVRPHENALFMFPAGIVPCAMRASRTSTASRAMARAPPGAS
jgi:hypothetical protein